MADEYKDIKDKKDKRDKRDNRGNRKGAYKKRRAAENKRNSEAADISVNDLEDAKEAEDIETAEDIKEEPEKIEAVEGSEKPENSENSENTEKSRETVEIVGVRFKKTGKVYYFDPKELKLGAGDCVIVETARGLEYGEITIANKVIDSREIVSPLRPVIRVATEEDRSHHELNLEKEVEAFNVCLEKIEAHKLEMKLVDVEYTFDNGKLLFYFTSDGRVDFRDLVKDLASHFRTRIELRQIGIRDEAKLVGGIGVCGRPYCCSSFLNDFVQVSIKMAKEQNLSLNSAKISGACGRLMCCLRYEYETYARELAKMPKVDSIVITPEGNGVVTEIAPLSGIVKVKMDENDALKAFPYDVLKVKGHIKGGNRVDIKTEDGEDLKELEKLEKD